MKVNFIKNIGFILLAIYLILQGVTSLFSLAAIPGIMFGILALLSGIFILIGR
jgi:hypothetical protein